MFPIARSTKLLIQEVGDELVIYDRQTNASHCLNAIASSVFRHCNGRNTIEHISSFVEQELLISTVNGTDIKELVYLALEELERNNLVEEYAQGAVVVPMISRRKMIRNTTLASGFAISSMFPLVRSMIAPEPAMAGSGGRGKRHHNRHRKDGWWFDNDNDDDDR